MPARSQRIVASIVHLPSETRMRVNAGLSASEGRQSAKAVQEQPKRVLGDSAGTGPRGVRITPDVFPRLLVQSLARISPVQRAAPV